MALASHLSSIFEGLQCSDQRRRNQSSINLRVYVGSSSYFVYPIFVDYYQICSAGGKAGQQHLQEVIRFDAQPEHGGELRRPVDYRCEIDMHTQRFCPSNPHILDQILDVAIGETFETKRNIYKLYNYVKHLLPNPDIDLMVAASQTLGHVVEIGNSEFGEQIIDSELQASIELLNSENPPNCKLAGVLIIRVFACKIPTCLRSRVSVVFDNIWVPLQDKHPRVREESAETLGACLQIVDKRKNRDHYMSKILHHAQTGLKSSQSEIIHASLLSFRELILYGGVVCPYSFFPAVFVVNQLFASS